MSQVVNDYEMDLEDPISTIIAETEISQAENDHEKELEDPISTIAGTEISEAENDQEKELAHRTSSSSTIAEAEISQAKNHDYEQDLEHLTSTVVGNIREGVKKIDSFFSSACIYKVPEHLRRLKKSAYTPKLIAIGPLHRKDEHLKTPLQHVKMSYTNDLLSRVTAGKPGMDTELAIQENFKSLIKKCLAEMKLLIEKAEKYYAAEVKLNEEMMLVDGCFILEHLYRYSEGSPENGQKTVDPIWDDRLTSSSVDNDLLLLENQIPFFVLEKLFELTVDQIPNRRNKKWLLADYVRQKYGYMTSPPKGSSNSAKTWCSPRDCVLSIFGNKQENPTTKEEEQEDRNAKDWYHILHVIHDVFMLPSDQIEVILQMLFDAFLLTSNQTKMEELVMGLEMPPMPSASDLVYAGVKFVPVTAKNLLEVKFAEPKGLFGWCRRAKFEIPPLQIYDHTEPLLRNLVALEQCCPGVLGDVSSYVFLMDMLVNSDKDVQVLEKAGVIRNYLGASQDATDLFNNLTKETCKKYGVFGDQFVKTCTKATEYSERFWPRNMAHLSRTYFSSPWTFIAFCVGFSVFAITFVQFVRDFLR